MAHNPFYDAPAIKRVQRGTATGNGGNVNVTIDAIDTSKSILLFTYSNAASSYLGAVMGWVNSTTQLSFDWGASGIDYTIEWTVLEFARGVNVQHWDTSSAGITSVAVNKVDVNKSFLIPGFQRNGNTQSVRYKLDSDGEAVTVTENGSVQYKTFQLVEWNGAKVQVVDTGTFSTSSRNETINKVDLTKTILFGSHTNSGGGNDDVSVCHLSSSTNLQFNKYTAGDNEQHVVYIVELPEISVQSGRKFIASGSLTSTETINPTFSSHTFAIVSNRGDGITQGDQTVIRTDRAAYDLSLSGTTLTFTRESSSGNTYVPWFAFEYQERLAIRKVRNYVSENDYSLNIAYDVDVDEYTPEKTWHWAWADEDRQNGSYRFAVPGTKVVDNDTVNVMIGNDFSTGDFDPKFTLVEFDTGVTAQHLEDSSSNRPHTIDMNPVDLDRAGIFAQMVDDCGLDTMTDDRAQEYTFVDSDTVQIDNSTNSNDATNANIQVLEFHDSHNRVVTDNTSAATVDKTVVRLDPKKSFLIGYSWQHAAATQADCDQMKTITFDNSKKISLDANDSKQLDMTAYPVMIDGPSIVTVQHKSATLTGASTTVSIDAVKTDRSFVRINGWNGEMGSTTTGGASADTESLQVVAAFNSSTEVALTRESTASRNVEVSLSIIEVDPYPITKFKRRCKLTIQGSQIEATGTYPVHLSYDGGDSTKTNLPSEMFDLDGDHPSQPNGGDIRVTSDAAGTTLLPLEIVYWHVENDVANGKADAWVRVDLTASTDKDIYIWWDAPGNVQQPSPYLDEGAFQVWPESEYLFVSHCAGFDVNTAGSGYWDSTERQKVPESIDSDTPFDSREDSLCGASIRGYNSTGNSYVRFASDSESESLADADYTAYMLAEDIGDLDKQPGGMGDQLFDASQNDGPFEFKRDATNNALDVTFGDQDGGAVTINLANDTWPANTEAFLVAGMTSSDVPFGSINGGSRSTSSFGTGPITGTDTGHIFLFNSKNDGAEWEGRISEYVIKKSDDGVNWDTTFYRTMTDPDGFILASTPEAAWEHSVPVTDGLLAQWDPSDSDSVELDTGDVVYVKDLVNGFNLYADQDHDEPSISSALWKGLDALEFDGVDETLAMPWVPIQGSSPRTIFAIAFSDTTGTDRGLVSIGTNGDEELYCLRLNNSNTRMELVIGTTGVEYVSTSFAFEDGPAIYGIDHDGTADMGGSTLYYGKKSAELESEAVVAPGGLDGVSTVQDDGQNNFIGNEGGGGGDDYWDGQVGEILVYDRQLTEDERNSVFSYLQSKWLDLNYTRTYLIWIPNP